MQFGDLWNYLFQIVSFKDIKVLLELIENTFHWITHFQHSQSENSFGKLKLTIYDLSIHQLILLDQSFIVVFLYVWY